MMFVIQKRTDRNGNPPETDCVPVLFQEYLFLGLWNKVNFFERYIGVQFCFAVCVDGNHIQKALRLYTFFYASTYSPLFMNGKLVYVVLTRSSCMLWFPFNLRVNLSPFTKDYRGGERLYEPIDIFGVPPEGGIIIHKRKYQKTLIVRPVSHLMS